MNIVPVIPPRAFWFLAVTCAAYGLLASVITIVGWISDTPILTDWRSTGISMMPNTAIAGGLLSIGLLALSMECKKLGVFFSGVGGMIGAMTLVQHITGFDFSIDQLFIRRDWGQNGTVAPGRMGLPASCSVTFLSVALINANYSRIRTAAILSLLVASITLLSLIGYVLNANLLYALPRHTAIAWQTSTVFFFLAVGVISQSSNVMPLRLLSENSAAGSLFRRTLPFVLLAPILLGWLRIKGEEHGLYDSNFGTALRTVIEVFLMALLLWWTLRAVKAHEDPLRISRERLNGVLSSISDRFQTLSSDWKITYQNAAMEKALKEQGLSPQEMLGRSLFEVFPEFKSTNGAKLLQKSMLERVEVEYEIFYEPWNQWIWVRASPNFDGGLTIVSQNISVRKVAEESLRLSQQELESKAKQLDTYLETAAVGLHRVGPDGIIKWANKADYHFLGYSSEEYVGRNIKTFHANQDVINDILTRLTAGEKLREYKAQLLCKDGSIKIVLIDSSVYWEEGRFIHTQCFTRDITGREQLEQLLRDNDRRKDEFLAILAHELRNPLAPILNAARILKRSSFADANVSRPVEIIERQTQQMIKLVDDLLDISRISRGKFELVNQTLDLEAVLEQAIETCSAQVAQKRHILNFKRSGTTIKVFADNVRLTQIFSNLLNNACKYTPDGGRIDIELNIQNSQAVVTIKDSGIGIAAEDICRVFEMFAQVRTPLHAQLGGLGIGLSLVKKLTEMQNGRVTAFSEGFNKGSSFVVSLPLLSDAGTQTDSKPAEISTKTVSAFKVLIADDNKDCVETFELLLSLNGHQTETAHDGESALSKARESRPDVVLLDLGMPVMDGFEVCRRIRSESWGTNPIIIAQTGWGTVNDQLRTKEAGFDAHLIKPVDATVLLQTIDSLRASKKSFNPKLES